MKDNKIYSWGNEINGELGDGIASRMVTSPQEINISLSIGETFVDISAGVNFAMALTSKGNIYSWGNNGSGSLGRTTSPYTPGIITTLSNIKKIEAGKLSAYAIDKNGKIYSWGFGKNGQLGYSSTTIKVPTVISSLSSTKISSVSGGYDFSVATDTFGNLYTFGNNTVGQLGVQSKTTQCITPALSRIYDGALDITGIHMTEIENCARVNIYKVIPTESDTYIFTTMGSVDTIGTLYDENRNVIVSDDDSNIDYNFKISHSLEAGKTYYIKVAAYDEEENDGTVLYVEKPLTVQIY